MKTALKIVLFGLLAAALALGVRAVVRQSVSVMNDGGSAWYEDAMLEARAMFLEKPDEIQALTAVLVEEPEESFLRSADGEVVCLRDGASVPVPEALSALLAPVLGDYEAGGEVLNVEVLPEAVLFFTTYGEGGCVGFCYEKELDGFTAYSVLELVENWKLFYRIPK